MKTPLTCNCGHWTWNEGRQSWVDAKGNKFQQSAGGTCDECYEKLPINPNGKTISLKHELIDVWRECDNAVQALLGRPSPAIAILLSSLRRLIDRVNDIDTIVAGEPEREG